MLQTGGGDIERGGGHRGGTDVDGEAGCCPQSGPPLPTTVQPWLKL